MLETLDRVRRTRNRVERYLPRSATEVPAYDGTFFNFVDEVNPTLLDFEHVPRLLELGERAVTGDISRLLVLLPPRYFKSEVFSRLLPADYLRKHPGRNVGLASYSARLAWKLSGKAREYYEAMGGETAQDTDAKKEWATEGGGRMWADGVGGSITGSGFHLGVIDDPMNKLRLLLENVGTVPTRMYGVSVELVDNEEDLPVSMPENDEVEAVIGRGNKEPILIHLRDGLRDRYFHPNAPSDWMRLRLTVRFDDLHGERRYTFSGVREFRFLPGRLRPEVPDSRPAGKSTVDWATSVNE